MGLPPGARLDIYLDAFQTLDSTEIIDRVDVDFTSALNVTAVISGYVMVPVAGSWQLRLSYSPLGDLRVDGVLIGGYIDSPLYCQSNSGTVDTESEAMATGAILQFQIRYVAGCWTLLWDRKVSLWWRKSSGDAWERVPAAGTFH